MILQKMEGREGSWEAKFPLNDVIVCSYEPHVLLGNLGNVDWRPMMNLWAVVEYVSKYAMKAPGKTKAMRDVLRDCIEEVVSTAREMRRRIFFDAVCRSFTPSLSGAETTASSRPCISVWAFR